MSEDFNITDLFFEAAAKFPGKPAIIYKDEVISFGAFAKEVDQTAAHFVKKGIMKGDRVMIFVPMSIDLYRIVLALFRIGATAVFLDEWVSKARMEECCKVAQCKAFIGGFKARALAMLSKELRKIPIKPGIKKVSGETSFEKRKVTFSDTALITFTTGSTGIPKAARRTHGFLLEQFAALNEKIAPQPEDIIMPVLPIVLLINLGNGTTSVIADFKASKPESLHPEKIILQCTRHKVSGIISSPFFIKEVSKHLSKNNIRLPLVKKIFTGGAPVFPHEAAVYHSAFPAAKVEVVYGSTEAEPISSITVNELVKEKDRVLQKGLNVGMPYRKTEVKIIAMTEENISVKSESELSELPAGQIGEIIVAGPHVLNAYINNEEAVKRNKIFTGDKCWHRTGDSGQLDENGNLFLTGRCNTIIRENGQLIAPFIYENLLQSMDGVSLGTVMRMKGRVTLIVELENESKKDSVQKEIQNAGVKFAETKFISKIPRDPRHNSKIDYAKLRELIEA